MAVLSRVSLLQALAAVAAAHPQANEKRQQGFSVTASETFTFNGGVGVTFPTFSAPSGSLPKPSIPVVAPVAQYSAALASLASRLDSATYLTGGPQIPTATIRAEIAALQTQLAALAKPVHAVTLPAQFASNLALVGAEIAALPTATAPGAVGGQGVTFPGFSFSGFTTTLPTVTIPTISTPTITVPSVTPPSITVPTITPPSVSTPAVPSITLPPSSQLPVYFFQELVFILNQLNAFKTYPASAIASVPTASFNAVFTSLRAELGAASGYPNSLPTTFPSISYQNAINSLESSIRAASLGLAGSTPGPITMPSVTAPTVSVPTPTVPSITTPTIPSVTAPTLTTPAVPSFTLPPRSQLPTYFFQELVFILNQLNSFSSYDSSVIAAVPTASFNAAFTSLRQQLGQASGFPNALPTTFPDQAYQSAVLALEGSIMAATANLPKPTAVPTPSVPSVTAPTVSIPSVTPPTVSTPSITTPPIPSLTGVCGFCSLPTVTTTAYVTTVTVSVPVPGTA